jgi:hypothetical protein
MHGRTSPFVIVLTDAERRELERIVRCPTAPAALVQRARIVLKFAAGETIAAMSRQFEMPRCNVRRWVKRFGLQRLKGLHDLPRTGRPPVFSPGGGAARRQDRMRAA